MSDYLCTHIQTIIIDLNENVEISNEDRKLLTQHLQSCESCRKFEAVYKDFDLAIDKIPKGLLSSTCLEGHYDLLFSEDSAGLFEKLNTKAELTKEDLKALKKHFSKKTEPEYCEKIQHLISEHESGIALSEKDLQDLSEHIDICESCWFYKMSMQALDEKIDSLPKDLLSFSALQDHEDFIFSEESVALFTKFHTKEPLSKSDIELLKRFCKKEISDPGPANLKLETQRSKPKIIEVFAPIFSCLKSRRWVKVAAGIVIGLSVLLIIELPRIKRFFNILPDEVQVLLKEMYNSNEDVAFDACISLSEHPYDGVVSHLTTGLKMIKRPEVRAGCVLALLTIGTESALKAVKKWEYLPPDKRKVTFGKFWTDCSEKEKETIFQALIDNASVEIVKLFIEEATKNNEKRIIPFCSQVYKSREENQVKISVLLALESFKTTGEIKLETEFRSIQLDNCDLVVLARLIRLAEVTDYRAKNADIFDIFGKLPEDGTANTAYVFSMCQLYFFNTLPPDLWSKEEDHKMSNYFRNAKGNKKIYMAAVLAQKNNLSAISFLEKKLLKGGSDERRIIISILFSTPIKEFKPCIEKILSSHPTHLSQDEIKYLKKSLEKIK